MLVPWILSPGCGENETPQPEASPQPPVSCLPDLDGRLVAAEVPVVLGVPVEYYVGANVTVDVAGQGSGATRRWDWSEERADDDVEATVAGELGTRWYAGMFPGGEFVAPAAGGLEGIHAKGALSPGQVVKVTSDALEITDPVAGGIGEAPGIALVENGAFPPAVAGGRRAHGVAGSGRSGSMFKVARASTSSSAEASPPWWRPMRAA